MKDIFHRNHGAQGLPECRALGRRKKGYVWVNGEERMLQEKSGRIIQYESRSVE